MASTDCVKALESMFTERRLRCQKCTEVPAPARFSDPSFTYIVGFAFAGSRHLHRPTIFLGVYAYRNSTLMHITCITKMKVPVSLEKEAKSFFNSLNRGGKNLWAAAGDNQEIRFYGANFVQATGLKQHAWMLIQKTDTWFKEAMGKFVEWAKEDPDYLKQVQVFTGEYAFYASVLPKDSVTEANSRDMTDLAQKQLKQLGFSTYSITEKYGKSQIQFSLTNEGTSTGTNWKMFPVIILVGPAVFEVKIVFMMNETIQVFTDPRQIETICELLAIINKDIKIGIFSYDSDKCQVYLHAKCIYCVTTKEEWGVYLEKTLAVCISYYKIYAYGFVELFNKSSLPQIISKCKERENYFAMREQRRNQEKESDSSSEDEASEENSESHSSDSDEDEREAVDVAQRGDQFIASFDRSLASDFNQVLPEKAKAIFCLEARNLEELRLCQWMYYEKNQEEIVRKVVDGLVQLKKLGVGFFSLPLEAVMFDPKGKMMVLPTFPVSQLDLSLESAPLNEDAYKFSIHSEIQKFLVKSLSQEKCLTLANFRVYRTLHDIDYIPPSRFRNKNLTNPSNILGKGGFGDIYHNYMDDLEVALKAIKPERASKRPSRDYLRNEFKLMQACMHENVVRAFGYTKYEDQILLVMEYCANGGLNKYLHSHTPSLEDRVRILMEVANGLYLIHAKNICHFDIKPQNILLTADLVPKICDFGLSQVLVSGHSCKKVGFTMMYAAPEQVAKDEPGQPADIWAFGILIYYTLFGKYPFDYLRQGYTKDENDRKKLFEEIVQRRRKPLIPKEFETANPRLVHMMRRCMYSLPKQRPTIFEVLQGMKVIYDSLKR